MLDKLGLDHAVPPVPLFRGGEEQAERVFHEFLDRRFATYSAHRNQPQTSDCSYMSMYLHFGMVSPVWLALEAKRVLSAGDENLESFLEELIIRRELAFNFVYYSDDYDQYTGSARLCPPDPRRTPRRPA